MSGNDAVSICKVFFFKVTDHHFVHNGVTAEDIVFPRVLLDVVLDPCGLP